MTNEKREIDPELARQIKDTTQRVHDLLNGPDGDGQFGGDQLFQKVVVEVPRAFVVLASYLAEFDPAENIASQLWDKKRKSGENIDSRKCQSLMRQYLGARLKHIMHADLHWLATHGFLEEPKPLEGITYVRIDTGQNTAVHEPPDDTIISDLDDEIPF